MNDRIKLNITIYEIFFYINGHIYMPVRIGMIVTVIIFHLYTAIVKYK